VIRLYGRLPENREAEGVFWVTGSTGETVFGPVRFRGEADNANAAKQDNVREDPTKAGGDHPFGTYVVDRLVEVPETDEHEFHTYGPFFLRLRGIEGEALKAMALRSGLGLHGGALGEGGILRATFGCGRMDNDSIRRVGELVREELAAGRYVFYECSALRPDARIR